MSINLSVNIVGVFYWEHHANIKKKISMCVLISSLRVKRAWKSRNAQTFAYKTFFSKKVFLGECKQNSRKLRKLLIIYFFVFLKICRIFFSLKLNQDSIGISISKTFIDKLVDFSTKCLLITTNPDFRLKKKRVKILRIKIVKSL